MPWVRRGFEAFDEGPLERHAPAIVDASLARLAEFSTDRPWFLWSHFFDPHAGYRAHAEYPFGDDIEALYDGEVAYTDAHVGRLLAQIKERVDLERTVIIIHADHGEELGDHGGYFHGGTLFEEQIHVPLLVRVPNAQPGTTDRLTSLIDLAPTLRELLGLKKVRGQGHAFTRKLLGAAPDRKRALCFDTGHRLFGARSDGWKLVLDSQRRTRVAFDLANDPREQSPRYEFEGATFETLAGAISIYRRAGGDDAPDDAQPLDAWLFEQFDKMVRTGAPPEAVFRLDRRGHEDSVATWIERFAARNDPGARASAVMLAAWSKNPAHHARIEQALGSSEERILDAALIGSLWLPKETALPALMEQEARHENRTLYWLARAWHRDEAARGPLRRAFAAAHDHERLLAGFGLAALDDASTSGLFESLIVDATAPPWVRVAAVEWGLSSPEVGKTLLAIRQGQGATATSLPQSFGLAALDALGATLSAPLVRNVPSAGDPGQIKALNRELMQRNPRWIGGLEASRSLVHLIAGESRTARGRAF